MQFQSLWTLVMTGFCGKYFREYRLPDVLRGIVMLLRSRFSAAAGHRWRTLDRMCEMKLLLFGGRRCAGSVSPLIVSQWLALIHASTLRTSSGVFAYTCRWPHAVRHYSLTLNVVEYCFPPIYTTDIVRAVRRPPAV